MTINLYVVNAHEVVNICSKNKAEDLVKRYNRAHVKATMRPLDLNNADDRYLFDLVGNIQNFS